MEAVRRLVNSRAFVIASTVLTAVWTVLLVAWWNEVTEMRSMFVLIGLIAVAQTVHGWIKLSRRAVSEKSEIPFSMAMTSTMGIGFLLFVLFGDEATRPDGWVATSVAMLVLLSALWAFYILASRKRSPADRP
jgi:hypothetical protein